MTTVDAAALVDAPTTSTRQLSDLIRRPEAGAFIGTISVFVFFAIFGNSSFLSAAGVASWLNVASELGIIAAPVGMLMIAGELDLSVGSVLAASSITVSIVSGYWGASVWLGIIAALALGLLVGLANGMLVTRTNVPSFVVTLATLFGVAGLTLGLTRAITGKVSLELHAGRAAKTLLGHLIGGKFEVAILWWIGVVALVAWILHVSTYGNWVLAVGGDKESARSAGVPLNRVKIALYMASGLAAALVGVIQTVLYNGAQVANGQSFVFNSIISVVIGGVLLTGGYGSVIGVVLGTLTFSIVNQGIYFTGWNSDWASLILGVLLLVAVLMNNTFRRMAMRTRSRS